MKKVELKIEEAADRTRWREGVRAIAEEMRCVWPLSVTRKKTDENWMTMTRISLIAVTSKVKTTKMQSSRLIPVFVH